ncbi:MAG TPA: hypothetical protein DD435_14250 [Cyanobacteria bacterium UBA8530]|nr:hypothetical protein [Cyanobacteria bacterium UBA8530]
MEEANHLKACESYGCKSCLLALSRERDQAQAYLDIAGVLMVAVDREGRITLINRRGCEVLGYLESELLGRDWFFCLPPDIREEVKEVFDCMMNGEIEPYEDRENPVQTKSGETRILAFRNTVLRDAEGRISGILFSGEDVTERKQAERERARFEALRQVDALKDQFLSILSHELRTPINVVSGFGSILDDELAGPLNSQQHTYLRKMLDGADVLLDLVNDLLDLSRIQAGKFAFSIRLASFVQIAAEVLENQKKRAAQKNQELLERLPPDLPEVTMDEQRVAQVLKILIGNAIKFTPLGGKIWLRAFVEGDSLRCEVEDDGIGIAAEDYPRLFSPFTQLDMSATRQEGGSGLGLSISKAIVEAHGGRIGVKSERGSGSLFWFTLPLKARESP